MDYQVEYDNLIANAQDRGTVDGYSEKHHIIPRSHGGSDDKSNLVELTAQEHFMAHFYLWKIHGDWKMAQAFRMMVVGREELVDTDSLPEFATEYAMAREAAMIGRSNDPEWRAKNKAANRAKAQDPEWLAKNKENMRQLTQDPEWRAKNKAANRAKAQDPEWQEKHKEAMRRTSQDQGWQANIRDANRAKAQDPEWLAKNKDGAQRAGKTRSQDPNWLNKMKSLPQDPNWVSKHKDSVNRPHLKNMLSLDGELIQTHIAKNKQIKNSTKVIVFEKKNGLSQSYKDWLMKYRPDATIIPWEEHQGSWAK